VSGRRTLVVFCREPVAGETKTRLIGRLSATAAAALSDAFIRDTLEKARALRPVRLVIAGCARGGAPQSAYFRRLKRRYGAELIDQGPGTLGRRMMRSLEPYSGEGVLLIGTDTPSLPAQLLERSLGLLGKAKVVIAPSLDGGYYAIGVRGTVPPVFTGLRWGSRQVFAATLARLRLQQLQYAVGPSWYDVDRWSDLVLLAEHLRLGPTAGPRSAPTTRRGRAPGCANGLCPATAAFLAKLGLLG